MGLCKAHPHTALTLEEPLQLCFHLVSRLPSTHTLLISHSLLSLQPATKAVPPPYLKLLSEYSSSSRSASSPLPPSVSSLSLWLSISVFCLFLSVCLFFPLWSACLYVSHCETISRSVFFTFHLKDLEGESRRERERGERVQREVTYLLTPPRPRRNIQLATYLLPASANSAKKRIRSPLKDPERMSA